MSKVLYLDIDLQLGPSGNLGGNVIRHVVQMGYARGFEDASTLNRLMEANIVQGRNNRHNLAIG